MDKVLYTSDLQGLVKSGTPEKDSIQTVRNYIDNWIRKTLFVYVAEKNLSQQQKNIQKQLDDYRESLLIYSYEKAIVNQKLDTTISEIEIENYYEKYKSNFLLKNNVVEMKYVITKKESPHVDSLKVWLKKNTSDLFKAKLNDFCSQYALSSSLEENKWFVLDDVLKQVPLKFWNQEGYLKYSLVKDRDGNRIVEVKDDSKIYVLNINSYKLKGEYSPLPYVENDIEQIILNKRKLALTKKIYEDIYQNALKKGNFEIYTK